MCRLNTSCDRSDWDNPDKTSSEYTFACHCFITLFRSKNGVRKMPLTHAAKILCIHSGRTCARCPQWPCALANRDVNEILQFLSTFSQYSNTSVPTAGGLTMFKNGESTSSSFQQARSLQGPSEKNCEICLEMSLTSLPAQHHYHCHSFRPAVAKLPKLSLLF